MNVRHNHSRITMLLVWVFSITIAFYGFGQAPSLKIKASPDSTLCVGEALTMAATIDNDGGFNFSYQWYKGITEIPGAISESYAIPNIQLTDAGTYKVIATYEDMGSQQIEAQILISVNPKPEITSIQKQDPQTCGGHDGSITLVGLSGIGFQLFLTKDGSIELGPIELPINGQYKVTDLSEGNYTNIYVIKNGCKSNIQSVSLNDPPKPTITSIDGVNPTSCEGNQGSLTLNGLTGTGYKAYYTFNGEEKSIDLPVNSKFEISGLKAGVYSNIYVVKNNCISAPPLTKELFDPQRPVITSVMPKNPTTCDGKDGSLTLVGLSGTGFKAYYTVGGVEKSIDLPINGKFEIPDLKAGIYSNIYVIKNNCKSDISPGPFELKDPGFPSNIEVKISLIQSEVCKGETVNVTTTPTGGTLTIISGGGELSNGVLRTENATDSIIVLQYTYKHHPGSECTKIVTSEVKVNQIPALVGEPEINPVKCNGGSDGSIKLTPANFTYNWSNGKTGNEITGLSKGTYSVTFTDSKGCKNSKSSLVIEEPQKLQVNGIKSEYTVCFGDKEDVNPQGNGGTPPYSYSWTTPQGTTHTTGDISLDSPGKYSLTITDKNGCMLPTEVTLVMNDKIDLTLSSSGGNKLTGHFCDGKSITLNADGAQSYLWSNNQSGNSITVTEGGNYMVSGSKTQNGITCKVDASINITQDPLPVITFSDGTNSGNTLKTCKGNSLNVTVSGNNSAYSYLWSDGDTSSSREFDKEDRYPITVTNIQTGCLDTSTLKIKYKNNEFLKIINVANQDVSDTVKFCTQPTKTEVKFRLNETVGQSGEVYTSANWSIDGDSIGTGREIVIDFSQQTEDFQLKAETIDREGCNMSQTIYFIQDKPTSDIFDEYKCGIYKLKRGYSLEGTTLLSNIQDLGNGFYFITGNIKLDYTLKNDAGECKSRMDKDFVSKITSGNIVEDNFVIDECGPFLLARHKPGFCYDWYKLDDPNKAVKVDSSGNSWLKITGDDLIKNKYIAIGYDCKNSSCDSTFISTRSDGDEVVIPCVEEETKSLKIYPNPVSGHMYMQAKGLSPGKQTLDIYDIMGRRTYSSTIELADSNLLAEVNLPYISDGIYLVKLGNDKANVIGKIIITH